MRADARKTPLFSLQTVFPLFFFSRAYNSKMRASMRISPHQRTSNPFQTVLNPNPMRPMTPEFAASLAYMNKCIPFGIGGWWPTRNANSKALLPRVPEQPPPSLTYRHRYIANRWLARQNYTIVLDPDGKPRLTRCTDW